MPFSNHTSDGIHYKYQFNLKFFRFLFWKTPRPLTAEELYIQWRKGLLEKTKKMIPKNQFRLWLRNLKWKVQHKNYWNVFPGWRV